MTPWVQESRQDHNQVKPKNQPVEDEDDNYSNLWKKKTEVMKTVTSAISNFFTGTCMFACAWENTLFKVFVGSNDQQWHQPMTFHMRVFYTMYTWLDISFVSITSNFTHKSCKRSTQHNVINRRTRLHSRDEMDSRVLYLFS